MIKNRTIQLIAILSAILLFSSMHLAAQPYFTLDVNKKGVEISPSHYGVFFEDINRAADGGLYAEQIRNRSFEEAENPDFWGLLNVSGAVATMSIETNELLNQTQKRALRIDISEMPENASKSKLTNRGYWSNNFQKGQTYKLSFFAKCDTVFDGEISVSLDDSSYQELASAKISGISQEWEKYTCELIPNDDTKTGIFTMSFASSGKVWLDVVSLFPPTFKNRENGLRLDLAQLVADMNPKFFRFPGGCFVEGDVLANRFQWKKSIGNIEDRPGHWNLWGYLTTDGMGYHEYLQFSEDLGAEPMFVANIGVAHDDFVPYNEINWYIQDALDAIEYANGDVSTKYGALRAAAGHPEPFNLKYLEIGNENFYNDHYGERYIQFYNAIKAKYPEIVCIGNVAAWGTDNPDWPFNSPVDLVDEHYYRNPQWFIDQYNKYDSYSRTGPKIYVGEYAVTQDAGLGNLWAALGEAVYMCGMEKNSDIVPLNSYAPMFVNVNNRTWNPDMINFNTSDVYGTPSYYVQQMFASNIGTVNLQVEDSLNRIVAGVKGAVGVGSWSTRVEYDNVKVVNAEGKTVIDDSFDDAKAWNSTNGTWSVTNGIYSQSSLETDCRSVTTSISDTAYTYSLRARKTSGSEGFLIVFAYQNSDNFYWWNLGGWGNTRHAVEKAMGGSKTTLTEVAGSIQSNVWYDIKIQVTGKRVFLYLNDQLIQWFDVPEDRFLYTSATLDEQKELVYFKVVNPSDQDIQTTFNLERLNINEVNGELIVLSSSSKWDENSLGSPQKVAPITESIVAEPVVYSPTIKANSVNIFKIKTSNTTGINQINDKSNHNFIITPNPASEKLFLPYNDSKRFTLQITNLSGIQILKQDIENGGSIDVSDFKSGVYIAYAEGLGMQKFVKY